MTAVLPVIALVISITSLLLSIRNSVHQKGIEFQRIHEQSVLDSLIVGVRLLHLTEEVFAIASDDEARKMATELSELTNGMATMRRDLLSINMPWYLKGHVLARYGRIRGHLDRLGFLLSELEPLIKDRKFKEAEPIVQSVRNEIFSGSKE